MSGELKGKLPSSSTGVWHGGNTACCAAITIFLKKIQKSRCSYKMSFLNDLLKKKKKKT